MALTPDAADLLERLTKLREELRTASRDTYGRLNPFYEDLVDWKETGRYWTGIDQSVTIYGSTTVIGDVTIGPHTWVGPFCNLDGSGGLSIGEYCSISTGVQLITHDSVRWALSGGRAPYERAPIRIGDCCFIGTHAVVVRGVTIGDHCLVAAGAVVTHDVPARTIIGGVPARPMGTVHVDASGAVSLMFVDRGRTTGGSRSSDL